jgi:hypothetical protein
MGENESRISNNQSLYCLEIQALSLAVHEVGKVFLFVVAIGVG